MFSIIITTVVVIAIVFIVAIGLPQLIMKGATTREEQFQARRNDAINYNNSLRK
jgi:hypothetical protein